MHHDPSEVSASARTGTGPRSWFIVIIAAELLFGGVLAVILWLAQGPAHSSDTPNTQHNLHRHFNYQNNPPMPGIVNGDVVPGQNPQNER